MGEEVGKAEEWARIVGPLPISSLSSYLDFSLQVKGKKVSHSGALENSPLPPTVPFVPLSPSSPLFSKAPQWDSTVLRDGLEWETRKDDPVDCESTRIALTHSSLLSLPLLFLDPRLWTSFLSQSANRIPSRWAMGFFRLFSTQKLLSEDISMVTKLRKRWSGEFAIKLRSHRKKSGNH